MSAENPYPRVTVRFAASPNNYHLIEVVEDRPDHSKGGAVLQIKGDVSRELVAQLATIIAGLGISTC